MYPPQLEVAVQTFGMEEEELDIDNKGGFYSIRYKSWILPTNGLVFQVRPKSSKVKNEPGSVQELVTVKAVIKNEVSE
jgi:hypothetical protein